MENGAFINDFIDICWVDPWSENPGQPTSKAARAAAAKAAKSKALSKKQNKKETLK